MVRMFVRGHSPFLPGQWPKQRMGRSSTFRCPHGDSFSQFQHSGAFLFKRFRRDRFQLRRCRGSFRKGKHVEYEVLEWKQLEDPLVRGGHRQLSEGHTWGEAKMLKHH